MEIEYVVWSKFLMALEPFRSYWTGDPLSAVWLWCKVGAKKRYREYAPQKTQSYRLYRCNCDDGYSIPHAYRYYCSHTALFRAHGAGGNPDNHLCATSALCLSSVAFSAVIRSTSCQDYSS